MITPDHPSYAIFALRAKTDPDYLRFFPPGEIPTSPSPPPSNDPTRSVGLGPGTQLKLLLAEFGAFAKSGCQCLSRAAEMDEWGVAGCRERRDEIVGWLRDEWKKLGAWERLRMAARAVTAGFVHPVDPAGALVDEAIRRAER